MPLSQNDIRALVLITGSKESINPCALQAELELRRETVSRLITHLVEIGLAERRGREVVLAGTPPAEAFKKLYFSHRASPLYKILSLKRVELLARLDRTPRSLEALAVDTGISGDTLYGYLKRFLWWERSVGPSRAKPIYSEGSESSAAGREDQRLSNPGRHRGQDGSL